METSNQSTSKDGTNVPAPESEVKAMPSNVPPPASPQKTQPLDTGILQPKPILATSTPVSKLPTPLLSAAPTLASSANVPASSPVKRQPLIKAEEPAAVKSSPPPPTRQTTYMVAGARKAEVRPTAPASFPKVLLIAFGAAILLFTLFGAWIYSSLSNRINQQFLAASTAPSQPTKDSVDHETSERVEKFSAQLSDLQAQLQASQKRLEESELQNRRNATQLKEIAAQEANRQATATPVTAVGSSLDSASTVEMPPAQRELVLLKERNRLTAYADEAIATGARKPYDLLWEAINDPDRTNLIHASRSEILRVQNYYLSGSRIDRYDIPVGDYFPESAKLRDNQLKEEQLIQLLQTSANPWQVRLKAAHLLGRHRSTRTGDALVKAIKEDENLDVVKEATFSFEQMTGFHAKIFEPTSVEAWWNEYNSSSKTSSSEPKPEAPAAPPAPTPVPETPPAPAPQPSSPVPQTAPASAAETPATPAPEAKPAPPPEAKPVAAPEPAAPASTPAPAEAEPPAPAPEPIPQPQMLEPQEADLAEPKTIPPPVPVKKPTPPATTKKTTPPAAAKKNTSSKTDKPKKKQDSKPS